MNEVTALLEAGFDVAIKISEDHFVSIEHAHGAYRGYEQRRGAELRGAETPLSPDQVQVLWEVFGGRGSYPGDAHPWFPLEQLLLKLTEFADALNPAQPTPARRAPARLNLARLAPTEPARLSA